MLPARRQQKKKTVIQPLLSHITIELFIFTLSLFIAFEFFQLSPQHLVFSPALVGVMISAVIKASFAPFLSPLPSRMAMTVEPPIANRLETATNAVIKGTVILTAASARCPTPCPTKIPFTILYRYVTHKAPADGMILF